MSKYRVTFNNGEVRFAKAVDAYSLMMRIGGSERMYADVARIDVRHVNTGEWVETGILDGLGAPSPQAWWVDESEVR